MSRITSNQQVNRAVGFLMGLRDPRVHRALMPYGLTSVVLEEGQKLLRNATLPHLSSSGATMDPTLVKALDRFENQWFPIVKATLTRRYPAVAEWLFNNLVRASGNDLVVSIDTFVSRLDQLEDGSSPFAEQGKAVMKLLDQRGFDAEARAEAHILVAKITQFEAIPAVVLDSDEQAEAVQALWAWYLEWSGIARAVIKDRRVLRRLGFLQRRTSAEETVDEVDPAADTQLDTPVAQSAPAPVSNGAGSHKEVALQLNQ